MSSSTKKCIIIGSGPAGYSAAIYAARADLKPILFAGDEPGGQLTTTTEVDNYPGYPDGIQGPELMEDLKKQALRFGTEILEKKIIKVELSKENKQIHKLWDEDHNLFQSYGVIISTGASAKYLGLASEKKFLGRGVSACATCDGFFYKGKEVAVVGGGDSALEEATYLANLCKKVYLLVRGTKFRASKAMQHRVLSKKNIEILFSYELKEIFGNEFVEGIKISNNQTYQDKEIRLDGVFIAIGHKPNTTLFENQIILDESKYILTKKGSTHTFLFGKEGVEIPGVFAAGDVQDSIYRQAITSAGSGCMAALDLEKYLLNF